MPRKNAASPAKDFEQQSKDEEQRREGGMLGFVSSTKHYLKPSAVLRQSLSFTGEMLRIAAGSSAIEPEKDPRFRDPAWSSNPLYKRLGQSYLAFSRSAHGLLENPAEDWQDHERAKFLMELGTSALAPTNYLLGNPAALKRLTDTRGKSLLKGASHILDDVIHKRALPCAVDPDHFKVGENLAVSPGAVIFRNECLEILQYRPTTATVYEIPLLMMTPQINKYYFLDLTPGRSFVEYLVSQGHQVFVVSWKNPTAEESHWRLDDYCQALGEAVDAVRSIANSETINTMGFCAGGITMTAFLAHLIDTGNQHKVNAISYAVTLLDFSHPASISMFKLKELLGVVRWNTHRSGLIRGNDLGLIFSLLRPNDLIWSSWVNNYLMGNELPTFDIMAWNTDTTNLPEGLHGDFLTIFENNALVKPGKLKVLGARIDLGKIKQDAFVAAAVNDHLTPWVGCYQSTQLLGGTTEFVLSSGGHVAALVNPPGNAKAFYMSGPKPGSDPEAWLESATRQSGSWWEQWILWASSRSGKKKRAKKRLGNRQYPPLAEAPGTYVFPAE